MTAFIRIATVTAAAAVAWMLSPVFGRREKRGGVACQASNLPILRQQLAQHGAGTRARALRRQGKAALERRVLEGPSGVTPTSARAALRRRAGWAAIALGLALPSLAAGLYAQLGNTDSGTPQLATPENQSHGDLEAMVASLATRLAVEPNDADGWAILARSLSYLKRYDEAVRAFMRLIELAPNDADALADYGDALAMVQGRRITGKPLELAQRALAINPNHTKALAMAGTEAFDRKDYRRAIGYWERAHRAAPVDSNLARLLEDNLAEAHELMDAIRPPPNPRRRRALPVRCT